MTTSLEDVAECTYAATVTGREQVVRHGRFGQHTKLLAADGGSHELIGKLVVFVAVTAPLVIVVSLVSFLSAQGLLSHYRPGWSLGGPGVLRVVLGTGIYLTLIGVLGACLGWIVRSTPGTLVAYFGVVPVLPVIFGEVLGNVNDG